MVWERMSAILPLSSSAAPCQPSRPPSLGHRYCLPPWSSTPWMSGGWFKLQNLLPLHGLTPAKPHKCLPNTPTFLTWGPWWASKRSALSWLGNAECLLLQKRGPLAFLRVAVTVFGSSGVRRWGGESQLQHLLLHDLEQVMQSSAEASSVLW